MDSIEVKDEAPSLEDLFKAYTQLIKDLSELEVLSDEWNIKREELVVLWRKIKAVEQAVATHHSTGGNYGVV